MKKDKILKESETNRTANDRGVASTDLLGVSLCKQLKAIIEKYERHARVSFRVAQEEETDFGKRFIEYGAVINFNHAQDLRRLSNG